MKWSKIKPYVITGGIVLLLFSVLFLVKGIYPFGTNSLIWGDMHDQVCAFYYHFYDTFRGNSSLFIDFTTSGGINFLGIFAYYLLSPVSFLILLFDRSDIYLAISILIAVKMLLSSLTSLYFIRTYFKRAPSYLSVLLAILYAFSGYQLLLYQITSWIDIVYLFPLLLMSLIRLLNLEKPTLYIVILTLCFIFSFYLGGLLLFFIFFSSLIYLYCFKEKETRKKAILSLGLSTILSILLSSFIFLPAMKELSVSSRVGFNLSTLLNSKFGPLNDKLCFFMTSSFYLVGTILLFVKARGKEEHQKVLHFFGIIFILLGIPIFIEPVNKMWHLGSYAFFPLRTEFCMLFLMMLATLYYFTKVAKREAFPKEKILWSSLITFFISLANILLTFFNYSYLQEKIFGISLGKDTSVATILLIMMALVALGVFVILWFNHFNYSGTSFIFIWIMVLVNIVCCSFLYFGIDYKQDALTSVYEDMELMENSYTEGDYKRVKDLYPKLVMNNGMVTKYHTLDHFTSLTDKSNMETLKKLGYSSYWVKTYSIGGSLFSDALLANQYIISKDDYNSPYYHYVDTFGSIQLYEHNQSIPYGYFVKQDEEIMDLANAFEVQNKIYKAITGSEEDIFTVDEGLWQRKNLLKYREEEEDTFYRYQIRKDERIAYLEKIVSVEGRKNLYLELLLSIDNSKNKEILESMNIYLNGKLYRGYYPEEIDNGLLDLGIFEDEDVKIRIEFNKSTYLDVVEVGMLDLEKYEDFIQNEKVGLNLSFEKNKIKVKLLSDKDQILFLPIAYNEGYEVEVNGENGEVVDLFDNFLGVKVTSGTNEITFTYTSPAYKTGRIISLVTLVITLVLLLSPLYEKILSIKFLQNMAYYLYIGIYLLLLIGVYLLPIVGFLISFFFYLKF